MTELRYSDKIACMGYRKTTIGLVAWYPFSGNAGDSSGHGHDGTVYGAVPIYDRYGNPNSAYTFNGTTNYIEVSYSPELNPTEQLTVSAWVNATYWGPYNYSNTIVDCEVPGMHMGFGLRGGATTAGFFIATWSNWKTTYSDPGTIAADTWYHLAGSYDGSALKLYINGMVADSLACGGSMDPSNLHLRIGTNNSGLRYFHGVIDEVRIYSRALSQAEIDTLAGVTAIAAPVLISPEDGSSLPEMIFPPFVWHAADSAVYYRFQLAPSASFSPGYLIEDFTTVDTTVVLVPPPQNSGPFWWRVTAHNGPYNRASETWTFGFWKPILISPPRDTVFSTWNTPSFLWHAEDSADHYCLWVAADPGFTNNVIVHSLADTSYTPAGPLADGHYYWKVKAYGAEYLEPFQSETRFFAVNVYGGVAEQPAVLAPKGFELAPPCPNPANSQVKLSWEQPTPGNARLEVYDVAGKRVKVLHDGRTGKGVHARKWDLRDEAGNRVPNGVYFCRLRAGESGDVKRLTVVR